MLVEHEDDEPTNAAGYVGIALEAAGQLARTRLRWTMALVAILALTVAFLSVGRFQQDASYNALQTKSAEQTVAEVQLRGDVNRLSASNKALTKQVNANLAADHSESVAFFCSIVVAIHDTNPAVVKYCRGST